MKKPELVEILTIEKLRARPDIKVLVIDPNGFTGSVYTVAELGETEAVLEVLGGGPRIRVDPIELVEADADDVARHNARKGGIR